MPAKGTGLYANGRSSGAWCSAINCTNSRRACPDLSFYRFPKDEERCAVWIQNVRRVDLQSKTPEYLWRNCRLCANHFEEKYIHLGSRLAWNAVPTVFDFGNLASPEKTSSGEKELYRRTPTPDNQHKGLNRGTLDALAVKKCVVKITPIVENVVITPNLSTPVSNTPVAVKPTAGTPKMDIGTLDTESVDTPKVETPAMDTPVDTSTWGTSASNVARLAVDTRRMAEPVKLVPVVDAPLANGNQPRQQHGETARTISCGDTTQTLNGLNIGGGADPSGISPAYVEMLEARVKDLESKLKVEQRKKKHLAAARIHLFRLQARVRTLEHKLKKMKTKKKRRRQFASHTLIRGAKKCLEESTIMYCS